MFKNWKTSLSGFIAMAPTLLQVIGVGIPEPISKAIMGIFGLVAFFLAKDNDKSGV